MGPGTPPSQTATTIIILSIAFGSLLFFLGGTALIRYMRAQAWARGDYRYQREPMSEYSSGYGSTYESSGYRSGYGSRSGSSYGSDGSGYRSGLSSTSNDDGVKGWKGVKGVKRLERSPRPYFMSAKPKKESSWGGSEKWSERAGFPGLKYPTQAWRGY